MGCSTALWVPNGTRLKLAASTCINKSTFCSALSVGCNAGVLLT